MDLIRNTCPPELNIGPDSTCTVVGQTPNNLHSPSTLSSVASTLTAQTAVSGGSMNILSAVVSVARRRHATSSIPDVTASSSSSNNFCNPSHINSELKENKNINNFLRLFQDCGRIPPLTAAANPHFPMLTFYIAMYIEMFSLPFRAWQEGSKCCTANKESDPTKSLLLNNDTGQKFPHPNSSIASSETTLVNEQLSKRLQRYSAIKQACRHLHTISTPILFCPKTRSKIVQLMKEEENAMKRTAQLYFSTTVNRRCCHRGQCSDASRRSSSSVKNGYSNVIDIPDYPVTKFLEDLSCLAQKIPLFSRGYLCCFPVTCHVSLCLRPDQVFHHLIEEHASYGVDIVRMSRSECSIAQTNPPYNKHLSYNFALVEQCHPGQESSFRSSSEHQPKYQPSSNFRTFSESHSISTGSKEQSSKYSALGIANAHHIVEDLTKLDRNFPIPIHYHNLIQLQASLSPIDGSITNRLLHLIVYLIVLDSKHEFPEFRLAKLNSGSCIQCPVDWPAVPPCLDPCSFSHQLHSFHRSPKSFGIEDTDISSLIAEPFFQNFSIPLTTNNSDQKISKHSENTSDNDIRWHMSYLSMCPSHQVQLLRVLRISQSILESRITQLIARSGVDCHKNLLWYKLFDTNSSLATQILSTSGQSLSQNTVDSNCQMEKTPSINLGANSNPVDSYVCPVLNHQSLSMREIEELVDSAPFQLDILRLDPRLHELFKVGACHLNTISVLLNREFVNSQQNSHHQTDQMKMNTNPKLYKCSTSETISCIAYRFSHSIEDKMDNGSDGHGECRQCLKNYMVLLSPSFTEGLIFLSWCETSDNCVPSEGSTVHTASGSSTVIKSGHIDDRRGNKDNSATTLSDTTRITMAWNTKKYKDFQFRAVFRAVGDPTNPSSMRRLVDSDIEIQNLFFKTSTLALVATNLIEKLSVLVWRTLHN
ncbi:unnamed protein product [Heterobilharzia americana]|nr:unnamed protein product [Heterobilharzia americana]